MSSAYLPILLTIQAIVDLALIGIVVYWFFYRVPRREKHFKEHFESLSRMVEESDRCVREFDGTIRQEQISLKKLIEKQQVREAELRALIGEAESLLRRFERERALMETGSDPKGDAYGQVMKLASSGMSVEEISKATGVPENEVRLLVELRK
jgi:hypothetical protein